VLVRVSYADVVDWNRIPEQTRFFSDKLSKRRAPKLLLCAAVAKFYYA